MGGLAAKRTLLNILVCLLLAANLLIGDKQLQSLIRSEGQQASSQQETAALLEKYDDDDNKKFASYNNNMQKVYVVGIETGHPVIELQLVTGDLWCNMVHIYEYKERRT